MKTVKIPESASPWTCIIDGVKYTYPSGVTMQVPDQVAALVEAYNKEMEEPAYWVPNAKVNQDPKSSTPFTIGADEGGVYHVIDGKKTYIGGADYSNPGFTDATYKAMLDGKNTTSIFDIWWPLSDNGQDSRYRRLERFAKMLADAWAGKTYTLRGYAAGVSSDTALTPLDDLAGRSAAVLATDTAPGGEDWAEEDPMTWYVRANALSLDDGTMNVLAVEGEDEFDITGETAPVYTFALALWLKKVEDSSYEIKSWKTVKAPGYRPYAESVAPDGKKRLLTWHPTFGGGLTADGKLTSGAGKAPYIFASVATGLTNARKWEGGNDGLWADVDTEWALDMWQLRHFNKENTGICNGCASFDFQPTVALAEENVKRVLLKKTDSANLVAGATVSVGEPGADNNIDRGQDSMRSIAHLARITSIADVTIDEVTYSAVNLDVDSPFTTTATTRLSTMPWHRGSTEALPGHKDGCCSSLPGGKTPLRVAGVELLDGAYATGLDPLYNITANANDSFDYAVYTCKDSKKQSSSITADYIDTGIRVTGIVSGWNWVKHFVNNTLGVVFPDAFGGSSSGWLKSVFIGTYSTGVRCPWRYGELHYGSVDGLASSNANNPTMNANWYGSPRLSGSGKKRGEWTA